MEVKEFIDLAVRASNDIRNISASYLYKKYDIDTMNSLMRDNCNALDKYNKILREELGVEFYVEIINFNYDPTDIHGGLRIRKYPTDANIHGLIHYSEVDSMLSNSSSTDLKQSEGNIFSKIINSMRR